MGEVANQGEQGEWDAVMLSLGGGTHLSQLLRGEVVPVGVKSPVRGGGAVRRGRGRNGRASRLVDEGCECTKVCGDCSLSILCVALGRRTGWRPRAMGSDASRSANWQLDLGRWPHVLEVHIIQGVGVVVGDSRTDCRRDAPRSTRGGTGGRSATSGGAGGAGSSELGKSLGSTGLGGVGGRWAICCMLSAHP